MSAKKIFIKTYGCQMNVYDSGRMQDLMKPHGFETTEDMASADLVILNTCHIREKAAEKVYSDLGRIRQLKDNRKEQGFDTVIAVAGCVAQAEGEEIQRRAPYVDIVVGPQAYQRLPEMVNNARNAAANNNIALDFATDDKFDKLSEEMQPQGPSAFLTIQEGCDKFCTFCVVPYTRGAEISRNAPELYREALFLTKNGAKEITLLGQNVNGYHGKGIDGESWNLATLIKHIALLDNLERIRYTTSHPRDVDDELIAIHGSEPKLMPFLHLPVQSGSDKILKEMNRKHTAEDYIKLVDRFRTARPDMQFSCDFIVGFPGETEQDFEDTLTLVREVNYAQAYSFKYSPRPGTPAAVREDSVPEEVKAERLARLQALLNEQQIAFNQTCLGSTQKVLLDRIGRHEGQLLGRSPFMQAVAVKAPQEMMGQIAEVKITIANPNGLAGELV